MRVLARRSGLTLVELMVALVIGAMILAVAHRAVTDAIAGTAAIRRAREALDRSANARRRLRAAFLNLEIAGRRETAFEGAASRVTFSSWRTSATGTWEATHTTLSLDAERRHLSLVMTPMGRDSLPADTLRLGAAEFLAIDYLLDAGLNAPWLREWRSEVTAPRALRVRVGTSQRADTLLFAVGERG